MNEIKNVEYKLEWVDHLFEIYRDFGRRNNIEEWLYFMRRPELTKAKERQAIAEEILRYILNYEHISQNILLLLEENFHYMQAEEHFIETYGIGAFDYYRQVLLGREEFPPYRLFDDINDGQDYDGFLNAFHDFYNIDDEDSDQEKIYQEKLDEIKSFEIKHPYIALLESEYYAVCKNYQAAVSVLSELEDCYYKYFSIGDIFMTLGYYSDAEQQLLAAMDCRESNLERGLISSIFFAKYYGGKPLEALDFANELTEKGYEPFVIPLKLYLLEDLSKQLAEKSKQTALNEEEEMLLCEYFMLINDYENVIKLCKMSEEKGFTDVSWIVNLAHAYFATGNIDDAEKIIAACYNGQVKLDSKNFDKIRALKAQLLFKQFKTAEAYELIEALCSKEGCRFRDLMFYAQMCAATGRLNEAIRLYSTLRFNVPENPIFSFELGRCLLKVEKPQLAHVMFERAFKNDNEFYQAVYYMAQASIDSGELEDAEKETAALEGFIDDKYIKFLKGGIAEMKEEFQQAKDLYLEIVQNEKKPEECQDFLAEVFLRYFVVKAETNAMVITMIKELNKALQYVPKAADIWCYLGELHEDSEVKEELAKECFERAYEADPYSETALINLINRELYEDNWQKALKYCNEVITNTQKREYYLLRANCELELGMDDAFLTDIAEYLRKGGDERDTYDLCSLHAVKNGDYDKAMSIYEKKLEVRETKEVPCYADMAVCLCKQGKTDEACSLLESAIATGGKNPDWMTLLFQIQLKDGRFNDAKETLTAIRKAAKVTVFNEDYVFGNTKLSFESGKLFKAKCLAESLPSNEGEQLCAMIYTISGDFRAAARIFKKLIEKEPFNIDHYSWMALCQAFRGKHDEAQNWANEGLEALMNKHHSEDKLIRADHLCQYGILQFLAGETQKAYDIFNKALEVHPCYEFICSECYEAYYGIALCKGLEGKWDEAEEAFKKSLSICPHNMVCQTMSSKLKKLLK